MSAHENAFEKAFEETYNKVFAFVLSKSGSYEDAEDIVQETYAELFLVIKKKGANYVKNAMQFVLHLAKKKLAAYYKKKKRSKTPVVYDENEANGLEVEGLDIEITYIRHEAVGEIWQTLKAKPIDIQKIFALYYYADQTLAEIARLMEMTESNVKHKLYRTLKELRKIYLEVKYD
jgi:RNA polymerase sigma-70 factor (ECF subfamily)